MKIAICTLYTPNMADYARYTTTNFRNYCNIHGYDFIEANDIFDSTRAPHWSKIKLLQYVIDTYGDYYDWLMWIDADAAIMNKDIKVEDLIDHSYDIIIAKEEHGPKYINTGIFIIKNSEWSRNFLKRWYEKGQLNTRLFDQPTFIYLYDNDQNVKLHTKVVRQKVMNSWSRGIFSHGDFIIHYYANDKKRQPLKYIMYQKDPNYVHTRNDIPYILNKLGLSGYGIEIGVERGLYSKILLSKSNLSKLYLCDSWRHLDDYNFTYNVTDEIREQKYTETVNRLSRFKDRIEILRMLSKDAAKIFYDNSLDFVYIDANHEYEYVLEDIKMWYPKVRAGGMIAGHDFLDGIMPQGKFGVCRAVKEFFGSYIYVTNEEWPSWYTFR